MHVVWGNQGLDAIEIGFSHGVFSRAGLARRRTSGRARIAVRVRAAMSIQASLIEAARAALSTRGTTMAWVDGPIGSPAWAAKRASGMPTIRAASLSPDA